MKDCKNRFTVNASDPTERLKSTDSEYETSARSTVQGEKVIKLNPTDRGDSTKVISQDRNEITINHKPGTSLKETNGNLRGSEDHRRTSGISGVKQGNTGDNYTGRSCAVTIVRPNQEKELMNSRQLAEYLQVPEKSIRNWQAGGRLSAVSVKVGRLVRYRKTEIEKRLLNGQLLSKVS
jgi:hypothetical protein